MSLVQRFVRHIFETYVQLGDAFDRAMKVALGLLFFAIVIGRWIAPQWSALAFLTEPVVAQWCERAIIIIVIGWGFIWLPFVHREKQEVVHKDETRRIRESLTERIKTLEGLLEPKLEIRCDMSIDGCSTPSTAAALHYFKALVQNICPQQGLDGGIGHLHSIKKAGVELPLYGTRIITVPQDENEQV